MFGQRLLKVLERPRDGESIAVHEEVSVIKAHIHLENINTI